MSDIEILLPAPELALKRKAWGELEKKARTGALDHHHFGLALLEQDVKTCLPGWSGVIAAQ